MSLRKYLSKAIPQYQSSQEYTIFWVALVYLFLAALNVPITAMFDTPYTGAYYFSSAVLAGGSLLGLLLLRGGRGLDAGWIVTISMVICYWAIMLHDPTVGGKFPITIRVVIMFFGISTVSVRGAVAVSVANLLVTFIAGLKHEPEKDIFLFFEDFLDLAILAALVANKISVQRLNDKLVASNLRIVNAAYNQKLASSASRHNVLPLLANLGEKLKRSGLEETRAVEEVADKIKRDLTLFSGLGTEIVPRLKPTSIESIAYDVMSIVNDERIEIALTWDITLDTDPELLTEILVNLVRNAVRFIAHDGRVVLNAVEKNGEIQITVVDNGAGMSQIQLENIRQRGSTPSTASSGNHFSLGLPSAFQYTKLLGGRVEVDSILGKGTTFSIVLPNSKLKSG